MDGTGNEVVGMGDRWKKEFSQCDNLTRLVSGGNRCLCLVGEIEIEETAGLPIRMPRWERKLPSDA